jgi:RNA polymerase sigma factor (TIGR02999 family)
VTSVILAFNVAEALAPLIERAQQGDSVAREAMYKLAFFRLRGIASALLCRERPGHTLQPTALVGELFLKLHRLEMRILNEDHFFRVSARAMRQVLIDHARKKKPVSVPLEAIPTLLQLGGHEKADWELSLAVKMVFEKLRRMDREVAETVWRRSVEGRTIQEMSQLQGREAWRVRADYDFGLNWMANRLVRYAAPQRRS